MEVNVIGIVAALGSAAAWALGTILLKMVKADVAAMGMTLATGALGSLLLGILLAVTGFEPVASRPLLLLVASGFIGITLGDTFFFAALERLDAHIIVVLTVLGQVFTILLAMVFLGEQVTGQMWGDILLIIAGVTIAIYPSAGQEERKSSLVGIAYCVLAVAAMSSSVVITKVGLVSVSASQATFIRMVSGLAGVLLIGGVTRRLGHWAAPLRDGRRLLKISSAVFVGTFGGFLLCHYALKHTDVSIANPLFSTEPLFAIGASALLLKENIQKRAIVGGLLAVLGAVLLVRG